MKPVYILAFALLLTSSCKRKNAIETLVTNNSSKYVMSKFDGLLSDVIRCSDGNYIICGKSLENTQIRVTKITSTMNVIWMKELGEEMYLADKLVETEDGGIVISGNIRDGAYYKVVARRMNANGELTWQKTFDYTASTTYSINTCITRSNDNNYVIAYSLPSGSNGDVQLLKISGDGDSLWKRTYPATGGDYVNDVISTPDNGYLVTGFSSTSSQSKLHFVKTDASGNLVWQKDKSDTAKFTRGYKTIVTSNGELVTCGVQKGSNFLGAPGQPFIAKYTSGGDDIWFKAYGPDTTDEEFYDITANNDGGYTATGIIRFYSTFGGTTTISLISPTLVSVSGDGTELWRRRYSDSVGRTSQRVFAVPEGYHQFGYDHGLIRKFFVRYVNEDGGTQ